MTRRRRRSTSWPFTLLTGAILVFLLLPSVLVVPMSFSATSYLRFPPAGFSLRWYRAFFDDPEWISASLFSLEIAAMTTLAAAMIGTMAAVALVRGRLVAKDTISALVLAPLIVPHVIVAIAVYFQFAPLGLVGTRLGFVLIHTALAVPYVVLVVTAALQRGIVSQVLGSRPLAARAKSRRCSRRSRPARHEVTGETQVAPTTGRGKAAQVTSPCLTALAALLNAATSSLRTWHRLDRERRAGETGPIDAPSSGCRRLANGDNEGSDARHK